MVIRRIRAQVATWRSVRERLDRQHHRIAELERELIRVSPQVAALEERVEALRQRVEGPDYTSSPEDAAQAASLVEEVKREHAQVRARISAAAVFEERLRVVEERLQEM